MGDILGEKNIYGAAGQFYSDNRVRNTGKNTVDRCDSLQAIRNTQKDNSYWLNIKLPNKEL